MGKGSYTPTNVLILHLILWKRGVTVVPARNRRNSFAGLVKVESPLLPDTHRFSGGPRRFNKRCLAQSDSRRSLAGTTATPRTYFIILDEWSALDPQKAHKKKKGLRSFDLKPLISLAGPMGLEPTASGVTGG